MWKNSKFRGKKGKKKYYTPAEKASFMAGLRAGKASVRSGKSSGKRRY